ncbi:unnamed protein product [Moneuplotes crassus]|uniref:Uncharacterized protein n=1 Tax=Euplotes crassus TaxID=5936 RepID=A0AAD1Y5E0_EUPCR|nr:unnamed protein product [Moneuplotes crassus]
MVIFPKHKIPLIIKNITLQGSPNLATLRKHKGYRYCKILGILARYFVI